MTNNLCGLVLDLFNSSYKRTPCYPAGKGRTDSSGQAIRLSAKRKISPHLLAGDQGRRERSGL